MKHKILLCAFAFFLFANVSASTEDLTETSNIPIFCDLIEKHDYEILDYSVSGPSEIDPQAPQIVEEYGVSYNLIQMPADYEIPTELKTFAMENGIDGIVIIPDHETGPEGVIAGMMQTSEQKNVLVVSDNLTRYPEAIVKILMGITEAQEIQSQELRSMVKVRQDEKGWQAQFAKGISKGIETLTGGTLGTSIDYNKITIEETGSFGEMFGEDKITISINGQGPYTIEIKEMASVIESVPNITAYLVLKITIKDDYSDYEEDLYIGDDGELYSCR